MHTMTPRQKNVYEFIEKFIAEKGYGPSYVEIKRAIGLRSKSGVHRMVHGLIERGVLKNLPGRTPACLSRLLSAPNIIFARC